jgi:calcium-dependent protein kinase
MAPEIIQEKNYDHKVDVWSIGVISYILLCGRPPFKGKAKPEIFRHVQYSEPSFDDQPWDKISNEAIDFVRMALRKNPKLRCDAKDLLNHEWIRK